MRRYQTHVTAVVFCWWMVVAACSGCAKTESKIEPISLAVTPTAASVDHQPQLERFEPEPVPDSTKLEVSAADEVQRVESPEPVEPKRDVAITVSIPDGFRPSVDLSEFHKSTCLKSVGEQVGDVTVVDMEGTHHQFLRLLSDRLTVLFFWDEKSATGMEQFRRIPVDILGDFAAHRVKVIAVNVGGEKSRVRELTGDAADKIVSLVDSDGSFYGHFASSLLPRTYVLDQRGTILWFDLEFSLSTSRSLRQVLAYFLAQ